MKRGERVPEQNPERDPDQNWYLAQLKPNSVKIAERNLARQGFETFLPLEEQTHKRRGQFVTTMRPLFAGYIFVSFEETQGCWRAINSTYGVSRLVSFSTKPATVPRDLVKRLKARCDGESKLLPVDTLTSGVQVTLTKGPFAHFVAQVEQISPERRVWVLMEMMGSQTRVEVGEDQLRVNL